MTFECDSCGMEFETTAQMNNHKKKFCSDSNQIESRLAELKNFKPQLNYDYKPSQATVKRPVAPISGSTHPDQVRQSLESIHSNQSHHQSAPTSNFHPQQQAPPQHFQYNQQPPQNQYPQYAAPQIVQQSAPVDNRLNDQVRQLQEELDKQKHKIRREKERAEDDRRKMIQEMELLRQGARSQQVGPSMPPLQPPQPPPQLLNYNSPEDDLILQKLSELEAHLALQPASSQQNFQPLYQSNPSIYHSQQTLPETTKQIQPAQKQHYATEERAKPAARVQTHNASVQMDPPTKSTRGVQMSPKNSKTVSIQADNYEQIQKSEPVKQQEIQSSFVQSQPQPQPQFQSQPQPLYQPQPQYLPQPASQPQIIYITAPPLEQRQPQPVYQPPQPVVQEKTTTHIHHYKQPDDQQSRPRRERTPPSPKQKRDFSAQYESNVQTQPQNQQVFRAQEQSVLIQKMPTLVQQDQNVYPSTNITTLRSSGQVMLDSLDKAFKFRQDVERCSDMEAEERALTNLAAQEYDALKILSAIPEGTELYRFKFQQYIKLSQARSEAELQLQDQRLNRLNQNFTVQKNEVARKIEHEAWIESQRRKIYLHKLRDLDQDSLFVDKPVKNYSRLGTPSHQVPLPDISDERQTVFHHVQPLYNSGTDEDIQSHQRHQTNEPAFQTKISTRQTYRDETSPSPGPRTSIPVSLYNTAEDDLKVVNKVSERRSVKEITPREQLRIYFDCLMFVAREIKEAELCFCFQRDGKVLAEPKPQVVRMHGIQSDFEDGQKQRVNFFESFDFDFLESPTNLVIEVRQNDPDVPNSLKSIAWTVLAIHDPSGDAQHGKWRLPLYKCPTNLTIDIHKLPTMKAFTETELVMRISKPNDQRARQFSINNAVQAHYNLAPYHKPYVKSSEVFSPTSQGEPPRRTVLTGQQIVGSKPAKQTLPSVEEDALGESKMASVRLSQVSSGRLVPENDRSASPNKPDQVPVLLLPKPADRDRFYSVNGLKIIIHYSRQPQNVGSLVIQATLYLGKKIVVLTGDITANWLTQEIQEDETIQVDSTSQIDVTKEGLVVRKVSKSARVDTIYPSNEEQIWAYDFYNMIWQERNQNKLLLLIQCLSKQPGQSKFTPIGYVVHDLSEPNGKIRYGTYDIPFLTPPIALQGLDSNQSPRQNARINFTVLQPDEKRADTAQFIPNNIKQYTASEFWKEDEEDGLDIYIDQIRHFPDNTSIVKLVAKVIDNKGKDLLRPQTIWPIVEFSSLQTQVFNAKLEMRGMETVPTAMLHLTFLTVETSSMRERIIGFAAYPLFINADTRTPVIQKGDEDLRQIKRSLHRGSYQMPIYCEYPGESARITYENFIYLERIPTASVLIRVGFAAIDQNGRFISVNDNDAAVAEQAFEAPPEYSDVAYSTIYYLSTELERQMFNIRKAQQGDAPLKVVLEAVAKALGLVNHGDQELVVQFAKRLSDVMNMSLMDLTYFSQFEPEIGFRYNLEAITNAWEPNCVFQTLASILPPASPYKDPPSLNTAFPFIQLNFESKTDEIRYLEDDLMLNGLNLPLSAVILYDIKKYDFVKKQLYDYGFAVHPLFSVFNNKPYFVSGVFNLPILDGPVNRELVTTLLSRPNVEAKITIREFKAAGLLRYKGKSQVIVKAVDTQRHGHFLKPFSSLEPQPRHLETEERIKYVYTIPSRTTKTLAQELPAKMDKAALLKEAHQAFLNYVNRS